MISICCPVIKKITEVVPKPDEDLIYQLLPRLPTLAVCVDVGAAAGHKTRIMRLAGNATTQVFAFEPFPGNHAFFCENTKTLDNVILIKKALSRQVGQAKFTIPSTVKGTEKDWEGYGGYSSLGYLTESREKPSLRIKLKSFLKTVLATLRSKASKPVVLAVETTTLDSEFLGKRIDFLKIDVQGAEADVLEGGRKMLEEGRISVILAEWTGDPRVEKMLLQSGYVIFDSTYVVIPRQQNLSLFEALGFRLISETDLSTGNKAWQMALVQSELSPGEALRHVQARRMGYIQTDLMAFHTSVADHCLSLLHGLSRKGQE